MANCTLNSKRLLKRVTGPFALAYTLVGVAACPHAVVAKRPTDQTAKPKKAKYEDSAMSALPPIADIHAYSWNVRFVPVNGHYCFHNPSNRLPATRV
jgi:hypothetical protein